MIRFDRTVKIGDLLTIMTIIMSVVVLLVSLSKDRDLKRKEQADKVRTSVAVAITKLDRWQALQLSVFQELQPVFVEASEMLAKDFNIVAPRDFLWKSINAHRARISGKILDEQIESAYVGLFSHFHAIREQFLITLNQLKQEEKKAHDHLLKATQRDILSFEEKKKGYQSAMLGDALRASAKMSEEQLEEGITRLMKPLRDFLLDVISKPDAEILTQGLIQRPR